MSIGFNGRPSRYFAFFFGFAIFACWLQFGAFGIDFGRLFEIFMAAYFAVLLFWNGYRINIGTYTCLVMFLFLIIMLLSAFKQENSSPLIVCASLLISLMVVIFLSKLLSVSSLRAVGYMLLMPAVCVVFMSLLLHEPTMFKYSGVFTNPNALGRCAAFGALVACITVAGYFQTKLERALGITCFLVLLAVTLLTSSRAALGAMLFAFFVSFSAITIWLVSRALTHMTLKRYWLVLSFGLMIGLFAAASTIGSLLYELIFSKSTIKIANGSFTSGRIELWGQAYDNIRLFGNFTTAVSLPDPHSTYFNFALRYGVVPAAVIFGPVVGLVMSAFFYSAKGNLEFLPELACFAFLIFYWVFETALGVPILWVSLYFYYARRFRNQR